MKGEPSLTINGNDEAIKVNSKTQFLVRTGDVGEGKYIAWTGYTGTDAKSVEATGYDIKMDEDGKYAEIVYLFNVVAFTDGTVVAYVPNDANMWKEKDSDDGDVYYILEAYINGVKTELKIDATDAETIRSNYEDVLLEEFREGRFYKFRYKDINAVTTAKLVNTEDFNLFTTYRVADYSDDGVLTLTQDIGDTGRRTMALAADCVIYSIREAGPVVKEDKGLEYAAGYVEAGKLVHLDWNDKNDDGVNQIVALYVVEDGD